MERGVRQLAGAEGVYVTERLHDPARWGVEDATSAPPGSPGCKAHVGCQFLAGGMALDVGAQPSQ